MRLILGQKVTMSDRFPIPREIHDELQKIFPKKELLRFLSDVDDLSDEDDEHSIWEKRRSKTDMAKETAKNESESKDKSFNKGHSVSDSDDSADSLDHENSANKDETNTAMVNQTMNNRLTETFNESKSKDESFNKRRPIPDSDNSVDSPDQGNDTIEDETKTAVLNQTMNTSIRTDTQWYTKLREKFTIDCLDGIDFENTTKDVLFAEDLNEDQEIYVVQCPKGLDARLLIGKEIDLEGETNFSLSTDNGEEHYLSTAELASGEKHLNLILPSRQSKKFQMISHPLAGGIVLCESFDFPCIKEEPLSPPRSIPLPECVVRKMRASFSEQSFANSHIEGSPKKKKKKHKKEKISEVSDRLAGGESWDVSYIKEEPLSPVQSITLPESVVQQMLASFPEEQGFADSHIEGSPKKKKKTHKKEKILEASTDMQMQSYDGLNVENGDTVKKHKKKKKKKEMSYTETFDEVPEFECSSSGKKKKKKKRERDPEDDLAIVSKKIKKEIVD